MDIVIVLSLIIIVVYLYGCYILRQEVHNNAKELIESARERIEARIRSSKAILDSDEQYISDHYDIYESSIDQKNLANKIEIVHDLRLVDISSVDHTNIPKGNDKMGDR